MSGHDPPGLDGIVRRNGGLTASETTLTLRSPGQRSRERDLVVALLVERLLQPSSKLATTRLWQTTTFGETLASRTPMSTARSIGCSRANPRFNRSWLRAICTTTAWPSTLIV